MGKISESFSFKVILLTALLALSSFLVLKHSAVPLFSGHLVFFLAGLAGFWLLSRIDSRLYQPFWGFIYGLSLLLLLITLLQPEIRGSRRWIEVFGFTFQPSEIVKPLIIIAWSGFLAARPKKDWRVFLGYLGLFIPVFGIVFKQPDLGNALLFFGVFLLLIPAAGFPLRYFFSLLFLLFASLPVAWGHLAEYQKLRLLTFLNPGLDVQGAGYNSLQAIIAIGSGKFFGRGLGAGTQSALKFLPEYHTDFIFASMTEQLGVFGAAIIIGIYFLLLLQIFRVAVRNQGFTYIAGLGIFLQLFLQVSINIGMNLGLLPITGVTLPFFSVGGSSILATFIALGIMAGFATKKTTIKLIE